jgi:hypothetical protein
MSTIIETDRQKESTAQIEQQYHPVTQVFPDIKHLRCEYHFSSWEELYEAIIRQDHDLHPFIYWINNHIPEKPVGKREYVCISTDANPPIVELRYYCDVWLLVSMVVYPLRMLSALVAKIRA